jgi:hypothetical protein
VRRPHANTLASPALKRAVSCAFRDTLLAPHRARGASLKRGVTETWSGLTLTFSVFWMWGPEASVKIKLVCWPQHVAFMTGVVAYTIGRTT